MATKKEFAAQQIARAVGAGKSVALETVDFSNPNRPKTCLEVDFPIVPINTIATIEGKGSGALKPIYQVSKWWARRRSTVFRSLLLASVTKAPEDPALAARLVWQNYYANHQKKGSFQDLRVVDIFMGGGTTIIEGARLGMKMLGNDLNPVAWFVVKQEISNVDADEFRRLYSDIESVVRSTILPFYYCDEPDGRKGKWFSNLTGELMDASFDPLLLSPDVRHEYRYEGPEAIYSFWAKHGPCQLTGCSHRTPIMTNPVMAAKTVSITYWECTCNKCGEEFHVEKGTARIAPGVPLYVAPDEIAHSTLDSQKGAVCPHCNYSGLSKLEKSKTKKVELSLLVHPEWIGGCGGYDNDGLIFGGSAEDNVAATARWNLARASQLKLLEVRGALPDEVVCPETGVKFPTGKAAGTVPKRSNFLCAACGTVQEVVDSVRRYGKSAPVAAYGIQAHSHALAQSGDPLGGRFFAPFGQLQARQFNAACAEWDRRKNSDLKGYWPTNKIEIGAEIGPHDVEGYHLSHWSMLFNPRQLLVLSQLLKAICTVGEYSTSTREYMLSAFQQYLRNQNMFCFWNVQRALEPMFSNSNFHPKNNVVENSCFSGAGRGDFSSCVDKAIEAITWSREPWEIACGDDEAHSEKVATNDPVLNGRISISSNSATDQSWIESRSIDVIITDPPFGDLLQYAELADFFYVWLRLALKDRYVKEFSPEYTPKSLEAVSNKFREPVDPDGFYKRLLTGAWIESNRILKTGGILAFTFHHSKDEPWVAVLESLFDAGFYLEATYPIRSDETKGEGEFGSKSLTRIGPAMRRH